MQIDRYLKHNRIRNLEIEISDTELPIFQLSDTNELNYKNFDILAVLKEAKATVVSKS